MRAARALQIVLPTPSVLLLACAFIVGCQSSDSDGGDLSIEDDTLRVTLPGTLRQLPEEGNLEAFYSVDGGEESLMVLDNAANQASVTTDPIPTGKHTFEIIFRFMNPDSQPVMLSMVVRELDVVAGSNNTLNLSASDYTYPDDDDDNFTNLQEVIARSDPNDPDSKPSPNRVFVTSATGTGDLSTWALAGGNRGLEAADAVCQSSAQAEQLPGTYKAWMSDADNDAYCRMHNLDGKKSDNCGQAELPVAAGPWVRTDDTPFGEGIAQILGDQGAVLSPVSYDELGDQTFGDVWTGTDREGVWPGSLSCGSWTSASNDSNAMHGISFSTTVTWTELDPPRNACSSMLSIMCFQIGVGTSLPDFRTEGKKVFFSSTMGNGNLNSWETSEGMLGINAGDAVCRAAARNAGLDNADNFKAWLSDNMNDAKDRLTSDGPWVRIDGFKVADNKADLLSGGISNSISQNENGDYGRVRVWTGTNTDGTKNDNRCVDWSNGTNVFMGLDGASTSTGQVWSQFAPTSTCDSIRRLYCFED